VRSRKEKTKPMKIGVIGGTGAMGSLYGGYLARAGYEVFLFDKAPEAIARVNDHGLDIVEDTGETINISVVATSDSGRIGPVDLAIVLVKGQHTEVAVRAAMPMMGSHTDVLTLQNGWGNIAKTTSLLGAERVLAGVSIHSVNLLAPGRIRHAGRGPTYVGELDGRGSGRVSRIVEVLNASGFDAHETTNILKVIWSKLSLNVCALPACALLRFPSGELLNHEGSMRLMRGLLHEVVSVASARGVDLEFEEQWKSITAQLDRARTVRCSMLQDVENQRPTEIDTITGAVVAEGERLGIPTPYNNALLWMIHSLQEAFSPSGKQGVGRLT
jgi:2-dehydropantoate 2-reductase